MIKSKQLKVGDCFSFLADGEVTQVTVIPCTEEHQQIVVGQGTLSEKDVAEAGDLRSAASEACKDGFAEFKTTVAPGTKVTQEFLINTIEQDGEEFKSFSCVATDTLESRAASQPTPEPTEEPSEAPAEG